MRIANISPEVCYRVRSTLSLLSLGNHSQVGDRLCLNASLWLCLTLGERRGRVCRAGIEMQDRPYIVPPERPDPGGEQDDDCRDNQCVMPPWSNHESTVACGRLTGNHPRNEL